jgi:outer membrane lipoprotein-sorting protein
VKKLICILAIFSAFGMSQTAEEVLDRNIEALGGKAAFENVKSSYLVMTMEMPAQGMKATTKTWYKEGGKLYSETQMKAQGMDITTIQACDGEDCYMENPMLGRSLLEGQEKDNFLATSDPSVQSDWRSFYKETEYLGKEDLASGPAHILRLVANSGMSSKAWFDAKTGQKVQEEMSSEGTMGNQQMMIRFDDYREVEGGPQTPYSMEFEMMNQTFTAQVTEIVINTPVPDSKFTIPEDLKTTAK